MKHGSMEGYLVRAGFMGVRGMGLLAATKSAQLFSVIQRLASRYRATVALGGHDMDDDETPARMVLIAADSPEISGAVHSIREINFVSSIFLLAPRAARLTRHLPALARAEVDQLFEFGDEGNLDQLEEVMRRCSRSAGDLSTSLSSVGDLRPDAAVVAQWCVRNGYRGLSAADVANHFAVDRKTVYRRLSRSGAPTVRQLLHEGRVAHAAALRRDGLSYTQVALRLGYSSASSVAMLLRRQA